MTAPSLPCSAPDALPADLPARWRAQAADLRALAAEGQARAFERAAAELEAALAQAAGEVLGLAEAALASGYSADHLRKELAAGRLPNAGAKHRPAIRRADLPRKAGHVGLGRAGHAGSGADVPSSSAYNVAADGRALAAKLGGAGQGRRRGAA